MKHLGFGHLNVPFKWARSGEPAKPFRISNFVLRIFIFFCFGILGTPLCAHAGIVFFDSVTTTHTPVYLKVLTKGAVFAQGGRLVQVYDGERKLGSILSGGDGYGFIKIVPQTAGLKTYEARLDAESDSARLLVTGKNEKALLFEIEVLRHAFFSKSFLRDAQAALNKLAGNFRIIYLTRLIGVTVSEKIIAARELPPSAILNWRENETFADLKSRQVRIAAVIGSADTISAAAGVVEKRFTFEETQDGTFVEDWQDILKQLQ